MKKHFSLLLLTGAVLTTSLALVGHAKQIPDIDAGMVLNQAIDEQQTQNSPYMFNPFTPADMIDLQTPIKIKITVRKENPDSLFNPALESFQARNYPQAIELSNKIIKDNKDYTKAYMIRGASELYMHDYNAALKDANKILNSDPSNTHGYNIRAVANLFLHHTDQSLTDCEKSLSIDPQNAFAHSVCSVGYTMTHNYDKAFDDANKALIQNPELPEAYLARGFVNVTLGNFQQAFDDSNKVIQLYPGTSLGYTLRAYATMGLDRNIEDAMADVNRSIRLNPNLPYNYVVLGTVNKIRHENVQMIENYKTAMQLFEKNGNLEKAQLMKSYLDDYQQPQE
jgi:tetratricopeptide (TPR) repeat protein